MNLKNYIVIVIVFSMNGPLLVHIMQLSNIIIQYLRCLGLQTNKKP